MDRVKNYDAFISYKHDPHISRIAHTILRRLEHYRPPKGSCAKKKRLHLCIDDQDFAAAGILNEQIHEALADSEYLIYLACPETLGSKYCLEELRYFKKLHDGRLDNIIVLLIKGEPKDVFPQELCYEGCWGPDELPDPDRETEVHWLDLRAEDFGKVKEKLDGSFLMIAAPLLHCGLDGLVQRERQWKKQRRMMFGMLCMALSAVALCIAYTFWLTWSVDYKRQAENALADGDDNKALAYYAKVLSLNPLDAQARINAQILLQKEAWPVAVKAESDSVILGNRIYPVNQSYEGKELWRSCITSKGSCMLCDDGKDHYYVSDSEGTFFEKIADDASYFYSTGQRVSDAWSFRNNQDQIYTFYWPEEKRMEKLVWKENFPGEWENAGVYALQPGMIAAADFESLAFYRLEEGNCQKVYHISLKEIFQDDPSVLEEYNISLLDRYAFNLWPSPDGSRLVLTADYWHNSGTESFCHSAAVLFDTETFRMTELAESGECLISQVSFQDNSQKLVLIYNNQDAVIENRGGAAVYDSSGNLIFQKECGRDIVPEDGYFCGDIFLLCDFSTAYFLDAETGDQLCEPLLLRVTQAAVTDDGQIVLEHQFEVRYCQMIRYSEGTAAINLTFEDLVNAARSKIEMKYQIADGLWLRTSDDRKEILLTDENDRISDRFLIQENDTQNSIIAMSYGISTRTAFVLDEERDLYSILIDLEQKKFASKERKAEAHGVLEFSPARNGVVYMNGFYPEHYYSSVSGLNYMQNDRLLFYRDPHVRYMGWFAEPDIQDPFAGLLAGESDYAVIVTQKEEQLGLQFFSMKNGGFLAGMSVKRTEDSFIYLDENDRLFIYSDGEWQGIWLGSCWTDGSAVQQLMDLSGYTLNGSRLKNNQCLENANAVVSPESFGSWSEYLDQIPFAYSSQKPEQLHKERTG